jgi:hypothetical protein
MDSDKYITAYIWSFALSLRPGLKIMSEIGMTDWSKINKNGLEGRTIRANKWTIDSSDLN